MNYSGNPQHVYVQYACEYKHPKAFLFIHIVFQLLVSMVALRVHKHRRRDSDAYCEYTVFSSKVTSQQSTPPVLSIDTASSDLRRVYRDSLLLDPSTGSGCSTPSHTPIAPPPGIDIGTATDWDPLLIDHSVQDDVSAEREIFEEGEVANPAVRYVSSVRFVSGIPCWNELTHHHLLLDRTSR